MGVHLDPEMRHYPAEDARFGDRAVVEIEHFGDALQHQAGFVLGGHGIEQKAQCRRDVLTIDAAVFLIGHAAAVVDGAEQHQRRRAAAFLNPQRRRQLLQIRRR